MVGKEGSAWRVRGFLTPPGRSQPSARSRQNLRPRSEARNPETRANWALCRIVAQSPKKEARRIEERKLKERDSRTHASNGQKRLLRCFAWVAVSNRVCLR